MGIEANIVGFNLTDELNERHINYEIRSQVNSCAFIVFRRYNNFVRLQELLSIEYPLFIIPPLPSKKSFKYGERFSTDFLKLRMRDLQTFLSNLVSHSFLSEAKTFQDFLIDKDFDSSEQSNVIYNSLLIFPGSLRKRISYLISPNKHVKVGDDIEKYHAKINKVNSIAGLSDRMIRVSNRLSSELSIIAHDFADLSNLAHQWSPNLLKNDQTHDVDLRFGCLIEKKPKQLQILGDLTEKVASQNGLLSSQLKSEIRRRWSYLDKYTKQAIITLNASEGLQGKDTESQRESEVRDKMIKKQIDDEFDSFIKLSQNEILSILEETSMLYIKFWSESVKLWQIGLNQLNSDSKMKA